ncbi:general substrate transporter [Stachybotrys elegans]|uniref:General substrate transporter n=1 Tax=Stachybotrys elegans TaxID=80388 RepID=A0A8K0SKX4_9HYPO|nr:general substrate transporter [Stachybotrys elegans]
MLGRKSFKVNGADCGAEALLLGVTTSIGGFLFGYDTGQISGLLLFTDFRNRFAQNDDPDGGPRQWVPIIQSTLVSLMSIGCLIGALMGAYTADWFGRRKSIVCGVAAFVVGNIIQIAANNSWVHMTMARFVAGLGLGIVSVGVPMFQSESAPKEIRGGVVGSYQLMITIGILVSNIINYGIRNIQETSASWRVVIGLSIAFSLPLAIGIMLVPESPRWLAMRDDWEGARMSMARLRGLKNDPNNPLIERDLNEMMEIIERERREGQGTWVECFSPNAKSPKTLYRTLLGTGIQFAQQWSGINVFFYYGSTIFEAAGIEDPIQTQLIMGAVNTATTFYGLYVVEKYGRRWPLILGALWQASWLLVFGSVGTAINPETSRTSGVVMIVAACMYIASFAGTWGPMAWVVTGETFPLRTRAKQASLATAANWLGNFMIGLLTPLITAGISYSIGFIFVATNLTAALGVYFFLYESRMLSLEHVDLMYSDPTTKAWSSTKWTPPGYITRKERDESFFKEVAKKGTQHAEKKSVSEAST